MLKLKNEREEQKDKKVEEFVEEEEKKDKVTDGGWGLFKVAEKRVL